MQDQQSADAQKPAAPAYGKADPLYAQAVALVKENQKASISMVQRKLHIAYTRAAYLVEAMEGTVVSFPNNGVRQVLAPVISSVTRLGGRCAKHPLSIIPCAECQKADDMQRQGICPECEGQGKQSRQLTGGFWKCDACGGTGKVDVQGDVPAVAVPPADATTKPEETRITSDQVGTFVDSVAGKARTPAAVAGRLLEEVVELGLAAGLNAGQIMAHVADALHNQALKDSARQGATVFPSQIRTAPAELSEECADVGLMLKDLCYVAGVDLDAQEVEKHNKFVKKTFRVSPSGTLYAVKPHAITAEGK